MEWLVCGNCDGDTDDIDSGRGGNNNDNENVEPFDVLCFYRMPCSLSLSPAHSFCLPLVTVLGWLACCSLSYLIIINSIGIVIIDIDRPLVRNQKGVGGNALTALWLRFFLTPVLNFSTQIDGYTSGTRPHFMWSLAYYISAAFLSSFLHKLLFVTYVVVSCTA